MPHLESPNRRLRLRLALICLTLIVHGVVCTHDFVNMDDPQTIYDNPRLKPPSLNNTFYYWDNRGLELYIPCTYTVWSLTAAISGGWHGSEYLLHPLGFHAVNLCCHLLSVLVVFEIVQLVLKSPESAAIGAAVFAVHPLQVEAIAWATGLKDVLSGFAAFIAIWLYLVAASPALRRNTKTANLLFPFAVATLAFTVAVLSKPAGVAAIGIAAVLDFYLHKTTLRSMALRLWPWLMIGAAIAIIAHHVQPAGEVSDNSLILRPLIALDALSFYLWKLCWPLHLGPDYGRRPTAVIDHGWITWTWAIPIAAAWLVWSVRRRNPLVLASAGVFLAGLLPTLGLVPFIFQRHSTVADRYAYLAMLGPAMVSGWLACRYSLSRIPALMLIGLLAICSLGQEAVWSDSLHLFSYAVRVSPEAPFNHLNYGVALASDGQFNQAASQFRQTLALSPQNSQARDNLALLRKLTENRPERP